MSYSSSQEPLFELLPKTKTPWTEFVFSTGTQAAAIALLAWVRMLYPAIVSPPEHSYSSIQLVSTPVPVNHNPQPLRDPHPKFVATVDVPENLVRLPTPQPKATVKLNDMAAPSVTIANKRLDTLPVNVAPVIPKEAVKTNVFSTGSSAAPTTVLAASHVQTGGFGDPNGIPAKANLGKAVNVAALGSFDLPSGPGSGNGTGGAKGSPGVIASSGFGNGTAVPVMRNQAAMVQKAGFGDGVVSSATPAHSQSSESMANVFPAEILSKPTPTYTQEARNLRIEGEVLLEVLLQSSGSLRVLRVMRGLGHGLDDNAVRAAEQIHFKPAMRDGQPADSTVVLHIIFQLA